MRKPILSTATTAVMRLARDNGGNTAAMMAAAIIPLLALIGSGLDMSRAHLVKSKMQSACDAGALAARRAMASTTLDQSAKDEGTKFFNFNFPAGTMNASAVDLRIEPDAADISTVDMTASTTVPTTIMAVFGFDSLGVNVECSADQDYINNDIMLVLDVTGSMNCTAGSNCDYAASEQTNSRLSRLRSAGASLYTALAGAKGVRTRYGFMPYSMTVNVGKDLNSNWIANPANYWQKVCTRTDRNGNCTQTAWQSTSTNHNNNWFNNTWKGCIEERSTVSQTGSNIRISSDVAKDDIDNTSATEAKLKWQPYDDVATKGHTAAYTNLASICPARAKKLATYDTQALFQTALNTSLATVGGYTNHDIGIMWGSRYLSGSGMFATENPSTFAQVPVARHIIFLTDGEMTALNTNYSSFGVETAEDRLTGAGNAVAKHKARFLNACSRARQMGMTIWVIALDVGSTDDIKPCASGDDHFYQSDGTNLDQVFTAIGKGIGRLRLTV